MSIEIAAVIFSACIVCVILFQLALAAGVPWGVCAMGGKFPGTYPPRMRVVALVQVLILIFIAGIVLSKAGLAFQEELFYASTAIWFVVAFSALGTFLNLITSSVWERRIWAPVSLVLLVTSLIVAIA